MKTILITAVLILSYTGYGSEVNETTTTAVEYVKPKKRKKKHRRKRSATTARSQQVMVSIKKEGDRLYILLERKQFTMLSRTFE